MRTLSSLLILVLCLGTSVAVLGLSPSIRPGKSRRPSATSPEYMAAYWLLF